MSITLTPEGESAITLPDDLIWTDEGAWNAAISSREYTTTGAQIIQGGIRQAGRPVTLAGAANAAWVTSAEWLAIKAEADTFGAEYTLKLHDDSELTVQWAPGEQRLAATPVRDLANPNETDHYWLVLKFITV